MHGAEQADQVDLARRLGSIAGMLGSDFPGERANAAAAATKILRQHGLTWRDVVERAFACTQVLGAVAEDCLDWRAMADRCRANQHRLSSWERKFLASLDDWDGEPTDKQMAILAHLFERVAS